MAIKSSDQISIVDLTDGYSVMLTNDSFTFAGSTSAAVAGSTTTTVIAMCGGTQVAASVDNSAIVAPSGVTTSVDTDPTQPTITISVSSSVTTGGTVDIPVSIDNGSITIHKMFTFQISFQLTMVVSPSIRCSLFRSLSADRQDTAHSGIPVLGSQALRPRRHLFLDPVYQTRRSGICT